MIRGGGGYWRNLEESPRVFLLRPLLQKHGNGKNGYENTRHSHEKMLTFFMRREFRKRTFDCSLG